MPTADTLNDAQFALFARIRSVRVAPCDYGSEGRGFESLPARKPKASLAARIRANGGGFVHP
jgi:hypothetical protein